MNFTNTAIRMAETYDVMPALPILESGGIILFPTDTIWGIGCDATKAEAVQRVFELTKRPYDKPPILLVSDIDMLKEYVESLHPRIETLLQFHKRPLTVIYEKAKNLPDLCTGTDDSVAIRIPQDDFCRDLIQQANTPIIAVSANTLDAEYPQFFGEISSEIISGVDFVFNYRRWDKTPGQPSVIARLGERDEFDFLRE